MRLRDPDNCIKLFCFPYAGGSSVVYHHWAPFLGDNIQLKAVELASRGKRINERLYKDLDHVVDDVLQLIYPEIQQSPYMIFGHSMGAMIAYELAQRIRENHLPAPLHLFFSGKGAMHIDRPDKKKYHLLDDDSFKKEILELGGTAPEFFEYPELMELFLPLMKNDFRITESHKLSGVINPFDQDISVFLGREDDLNAEQCDEWVRHTTQACHHHYFPGGHFFINDEKEAILKIIRDVATQAVVQKA